MIWDDGAVDIQASNVHFSKSYRLIRSEQTGLENLYTEQAQFIQRYFRYILAEDAKQTLPTMIKSFLEHRSLHQPILFSFFGYSVFDSGCIPSNPFPKISIESIRELRNIDSMDIIPMPRKPEPSQ